MRSPAASKPHHPAPQCPASQSGALTRSRVRALDTEWGLHWAANPQVGLRRDRSSLGYEQYDGRLWRPARSLATVLTSADGWRMSTSILGVSLVSARSAASRAQTRAQILAADLRFSGRPKCAIAYASPGWSSRRRQPSLPNRPVIFLYACLVDTTLAWTVVGSAAGVVGVGVTVAATVIQSRAGRPARPTVTAELAQGQLGEDGVLCVEYVSGEMNAIMVSKPGEAKASADRKPRKKARRNPKSQPVNAIFIHNRGQTPVTLSHCHYVSDLDGVAFRFEPQPGASPRGDRLPKRLEPGEDALLIHEFVAMPIFLNHVLKDHGVDAAVFEVVLTLGHGVEVVASPPIQVQADIGEEETAVAGTRLVRQEIELHPSYVRPAHAGPWRRFRRTTNRSSEIPSLSGYRSGCLGSAIGLLTCGPSWRDLIDFPRFTPVVPTVLGLAVVGRVLSSAAAGHPGGTRSALDRFRETSIVDRRVRGDVPLTLCLAASVCF